MRKSIAPIFQACENPLGMAIAEEPANVLQHHETIGLLEKNEMEYNTGVIVFRHGSSIIQDWAKCCIESNHILRGDQEALSRMALLRGVKLPSLLPIYNQRWHLLVDPGAVIIHFLGSGKKMIQFQISFLRDKLAVDFSLD